MSGICGWFDFSQDPANNQTLANHMAAALATPHTAPAVVMPRTHSAIAGVALPGVLHSFQADGRAIMIYGSYYAAPGENPAARFLSAYREYGIDALRELSANDFKSGFALACIDEKNRELLLAIDRIGIHSLSYTQRGDTWVFGASADAINRHPSVDAQVDPQQIYNYIHFHMIPGPDTVYRHQRRLLPGGYLHFKSGKTDIGHYWRPHFTEPARADREKLAQQFNDIIRDNTAAARDNIAAGTFLSGGTDSSTVTGYAQRGAQRPLPSYSIGFDAEGFDETYYARIAAKHFKTDHHEYYLKPQEVADAIPEIAAKYDQPFGNASAAPTLGCARLAKFSGTVRMLAGDGGDELFGGNARYAKQQIFAIYDRIPASLKKNLIEPMAGILPDAIAPLRKIRRYIEQARLPMPDRMETYNLLTYFGAENIFTAEFLASIDTTYPKKALRDYYDDIDANNLLNYMLGLDFKITLADSDLPKVTQMCDLAGVEVVFPMLAPDLIDLSTGLPASYKLQGKRLRPFFKDSLRHFLPPEIISKTKHGFGLPFGVWALNHPGLKAVVFDSLADLKKRKIIKAEFIDRLAEKHLPEHPNYFGVMVWLLVILEQWFQKHGQ